MKCELQPSLLLVQLHGPEQMQVQVLVQVPKPLLLPEMVLLVELVASRDATRLPDPLSLIPRSLDLSPSSALPTESRRRRRSQPPRPQPFPRSLSASPSSVSLHGGKWRERV